MPAGMKLHRRGVILNNPEHNTPLVKIFCGLTANLFALRIPRHLLFMKNASQRGVTGVSKKVVPDVIHTGL